METRPDHHHLRHLRQKGNYIYLVLGIILIMPLIWQEYGSDEIRKWHPFYDVEYSFYWYLTITFMRLKPVLYLIVARLARPRHYILIYCFIIYEGTMFIDHILVYSQSDTRKWISLLLATYMVYYHYRYEHFR